MSWPASPAWLLELQGRFGALLQRPLDRSSGALNAQTAEYDDVLVAAIQPSDALSARDRLAVYHRQYWFRLLTVLQGLFPLTARLLGYWHFNELAARHLTEHPPVGFDIDAVGEGFADGVARGLLDSSLVLGSDEKPLEAAAVIEAAHVDAGFHRVTRAAPQEPFRLGPEDLPRLPHCRFDLSPAVALLAEHWSLCQARLALLESPSETRPELGDRLPAARHWLLARHGAQLGLLALEPGEAELLQLLQREPLESALGRLEASANDVERAALPGRARDWLARSVRLGVWRGLSGP